jgi:hypothetical protein
MPNPSPVLSQQVRDARIDSFGGVATISRPITFSEVIKTINFDDGEIVSIVLNDDRLLKRGTVVKVSSSYTGRGVAVVISFSFGKTQLPIVVSMGGAEGELVACVHPAEIGFLP